MGQPDSYGNQSTCVVEYAVLWNDMVWTAEMHDIPAEMYEDDAAANAWARENLMPYAVVYAKGRENEHARYADDVVVRSWP